MPPVSDPTPPRLGVSRRTLTRGAAWTAPAVIVGVAAPAYAVSCIGPYRLNWGTTTYNKSTNGGTQTGIALVTATSGPGTPVTVTFTSTVTGSATRAPENLTVPAQLNIGNLGANEQGLSLRHSDHGAGRDNRQTVVVTFSRAVTNLSFTITDIDSYNPSGSNNDYWDSVELDGARNRTTGLGTLNGDGTTNNAWRQTGNNTAVDDQSAAGNVGINYPGSVSTMTLLFYSQNANAEHRVFLSDFTFSAACT